MADLFLSYAREDRDCAEHLAHALTDRGWSVWWDRRIQVGRSFSEVIEQQLEAARCVVVLWSRDSVQSHWVQSEASEAARRNRLVPVRIENVRPPLEFRRLQTAEWLDWKDGVDSPGFGPCLEAIEFLVSHTASKPLPTWEPAEESPPPPPEPAPAGPKRSLLVAAAIALGLLGFSLGWLLGLWAV